MGFHEDDRIRSKNVLNEKAYQLYLNLTEEGLSQPEIERYALQMSASQSDSNRNEIYLTVLRIVRRSCDTISTG